MALTKQDYTTFTKVDPNSHLTVTADHLDFDAYKNEGCYLYKDYGVDYFGDFEHNVDVKGVSGTNLSTGYFWALANDIGDGEELRVANGNFLGVRIYFFDNIPYIYLEECYNGRLYSDNWTGVINTMYYLAITKSGTSFTCRIYFDSARTNLLGTLSLTLNTNLNYRYLYGCNTFNMGIAADCTLDIESLSFEIPPIVCGNPTPHFSSGCELLLHYDINNDGLINLNELTQSYYDYENGIITEDEFDFVSDAYINGGINVICPGCWTAPQKKTVSFESVPTGATVTVD